MILVKTKQNGRIIKESQSPHKRPVCFYSNYSYSVTVRLKRKNPHLCPNLYLDNAIEAEQ